MIHVKTAAAGVISLAATLSSTVSAEETKRIEKIPYQTKTVDDPTLPLGERKVVQKGVEGEKEITGGTTSSRKSVDLLAIIDTSSSMVENFGRALDSAENLVKSMTDNDTITFAHYQTNGNNSYNTGNGKADSTSLKSMFLGAMTEPMTKAQAIKYLEDAKTFKVGSNGVQLTDFLPAMEGKGYNFQKEDGKGFQDVYMAHHKGDSTISVIQFTDGWMNNVSTSNHPTLPRDESIDMDFADWAKKNAKTFMTVAFKNNGGANGGPTDFSVRNMKAVGHPNIYDERQTPIDDAKIVKQFEETAIEKQVSAKETVIKLPVDEIIHVGTKKEVIHPGTVYRVNSSETAGTIKVVQEEQVGINKPGQERIIEVGTKPKTDVTKLPFETKYIEDPNLDRGVERIVEVGKEGSSSVTTTYGLTRERDAYRDSDDYRDPNKVSKGVLKETAEAPKVTPKVDRVIARGIRGITRFVDKATGVELVAREKGNVAKKDIPEYRFVNTETSKEGDVTHYYEQLVTRYVDKATGKEIAPMVKGLTDKQVILGYRFVETKTDANGDRRHVYEQVSTHFVDEAGKEISSTVKGIVAKKDISNYTYVRQTSADNGDVIHVYHAMMTHFVDELTGDVLAQPEAGNKPKKDIAGFTYHTSKIDGEGDMRHFYNGVVTRFVDRIAGAEIAHFEPGRAPKKDIKGYRFFGTTVNDNGHTRHAYEMIVTRFVDKTGKELKKLEKGHAQEAKIDGYRLVSKELKDNGYSKKDEDKDLIYMYEEVSTQFVDESGKALSASEKGLKEAKTIDGYHVVETKVAQNGDRVYVYAKVVKVESNVESKAEPKAEPKVEPKAEPKVELKVEPKVEPKAEPKHNHKADLKDDVAVEPKVTPAVEPKAEPKVEPKVEPKAESKVEPKSEPKVGPKVEPKAEPKVETPKVETPKVETKDGKVIDIKPTTVRVSSDNLIPAKNVVKADSNDVDVVKDVPKAEQPKVEQPKAEQPKTETPNAEQHKAEQPKAKQPKAEQPKTKTTTNKELPDAGDITLMARLSAIPVLGLGFAMLRRRKERED